MSKGKYEIDLGIGWIFWLALIVLCWGEPDVLDGLIKRANDVPVCKEQTNAH